MRRAEESTAETATKQRTRPGRRPVRVAVCIATGLASALATALVLASFPPPATAADRGLAGDAVKVRANRGKRERAFTFRARDSRIRVGDFDPRDEDVALIVVGLGDVDGSSGRIQLDSARWTEKREDGELVGYRYLDRTASSGGIRKVIWQNGSLLIKARGPNWPWKPAPDLSQVWVEILTADDTFCSGFDSATGAVVRRSGEGVYKAKDSSRPAACLSQICGNGVEEAGEECDDGNAVDDDGCTNVCTIGTCGSPDYPSTYDAIQAVIFDEPAYQCSSAACHGTARSGDLDLRAGVSFAELSTRWVPGDASASLVWQKIAERTLGAPDSPGSAMPIGNSPVLADELEALALWIDAGAERDSVVAGTDALLGVCLPVAAPPP
jgi:cysteine-rich repeat protein